jgi:hypothetical protein
MNRLEQGSFALVADGTRLEPVSREKNMVGFCSRCESELESLAYHCTQSGWLVCARCQKEHLTLMSYDQEWNWLSDQELEICEDEASISSFPKEKLDAIFTPAEIRDMLAFEQGQPYTRQNLYRARAKFERFEKLFGTKINL